MISTTVQAHLRSLGLLIGVSVAAGIGCSNAPECDPVECPASAGQCEIRACDDFDTCVVIAYSTGACNDGDACTLDDTCVSGSCEGSPTDCSALNDACHVGVCRPADGSCGQEPSVDCARRAGPCSEGVCDVAAGGCVNTPKVDGAGCYADLFCSENDTCRGGACVSTSGACQAPWIVVAVGGTVSETNAKGSAWDGGLGSRRPDPRFCLQIGDGRQCTGEAVDSVTPSWNAAFPALPTAELAIGLPYVLLDVDDSVFGGGDDVICEGVLSFSEAQFSAGVASLECPFANLNFTLAPQ